jgi:hypothetical protein
MKTTDDLILETLSKGLQASFEALNELARDLSPSRARKRSTRGPTAFSAPVSRWMRCSPNARPR